ncbi:ATP-binding protein [Rhizobium ruizarguesonis]
MTRTSIKDFAGSTGVWIACLGLITLLLVSLAGLVWVLRTPDDVLPTFRKQLETIRNTEAHWDAEILSLQLGIASNDDAVSTAARDLKLGLKKLQISLGANGSLAPLEPDLKNYVDLVAHKDWLSEQVKASYAMLRNAVTVLPTAVADSLGQAEVLQPVAGTNERMSDVITEVVTGMASYTTSPTAPLRDTVQTRIETTRAAARSLTPALQESVERLLAQTTVALRERQRGNDLMLALTAVPTTAAAAKMQADIQSLDELRRTQRNVLWYLAASLSGLLVLAFVTFVVALRFRFAKLDMENRLLQQANTDVEEKLVQSAKLSALGQMVAGITHEINTPLAYVKAVFELIKERVLLEPEYVGGILSDHDMDIAREKREEMQILLDDGLHGLSEMSTLVRTMKNFSRMDKGHIESFSVEEGIESALLLARPQLKYVCDIKREFDSVPEIMGSPSQLRQVLLNLIVNASDAMAEMGRPGILTLRTRITSSDTVEIDVCDNGPGIPEEHLSKIFDPFYTTKPVGKGTGMGLSICYRIIENHGGTITVNSRPGKGAVFTITLPRQDEKHLIPHNRLDLYEGDHDTAQVA